MLLTTPGGASFTVTLANEEATRRLAIDIAAALEPGDLITLSGDLGADKTTFARALIRHVAGEDTIEVPSPTFTFLQTYELPRLILVHADLYRVAGTAELAELGFDDLPDGAVVLVETVADVATLEVRDPENLAYATQTTLSVDETTEILAALQARFPAIAGPKKEDICYATTNRQAAVKAISPKVDALLVLGAPNSSNSKRLVEVAKTHGCPAAQLVQRATDIDWNALAGVTRLGITAGASAPEVLVEEVIDAARARFDVTVEELRTATENIVFKLPRALSVEREAV